MLCKIKSQSATTLVAVLLFSGVNVRRLKRDRVRVVLPGKCALSTKSKPVEKNAPNALEEVLIFLFFNCFFSKNVKEA